MNRLFLTTLKLAFPAFLVITLAMQSTAQNAHVNNPAFARKISSMIKMSVPLMDVDYLNEHFSEYYLIDTRKKEEYNLSHLKNAHLLYYKANDKQLKQIPKDKPIVVYCSIGVRSELLGERLQQMGYQVYNLYGGLFEWANRNLPVYKKSENTELPSNTIHQYNFMWGKWMNNKNYKKQGMIFP